MGSRLPPALRLSAGESAHEFQACKTTASELRRWAVAAPRAAAATRGSRAFGVPEAPSGCPREGCEGCGGLGGWVRDCKGEIANLPPVHRPPSPANTLCFPSGPRDNLPPESGLLSHRRARPEPSGAQLEWKITSPKTGDPPYLPPEFLKPREGQNGRAGRRARD